MRIASVCFVSLILSGIALSAPSSVPESSTLSKRSDEMHGVSLIGIIANPADFDGKYVEVGGYLVFGREYGNALFLDETSERNGMSANSIGVEFDTEHEKRAQGLNRRYVILSGQFKAGDSAFGSGTLHGVYYVAPAETEARKVDKGK